MKRILALLLSFAMVFSLCACGDGGSDDYVPTGDALVMEGMDPESVNPTESGGPQQLTMVYYPDRSLNPLVCTDFTNRALFSFIYQGLFNVSADYEVVPILCENYRVSADNKTWTFYLSKDAKFSDGVTVTANDVLATYQACMESGYYAGRFTHVDNIAISGDGGIIFTLDKPFENFAILLDVPILKASQVSADRPVGSGPYILEPSLDGDQLRRDQTWWCETEIPVTAEAIALVKAENATQIRDAFEFYGVGLVCANPASDYYADFRGDFELWECDNGIFLFIGCNVAYSEVLSDSTVRTALSYALNRQAIVDQFYGGFAEPTTLCCSPNSPYYSQVLADKYTYEPTRLVNALAAFGPIENPIKLLVNSDDSLRVKVARNIAETLTELGLPTVTVEKPTAEYQRDIYLGSYDMYLGQTKLSANMDLSEFFATWGNMSRNGVADAELYTLCKDALANKGNYYNLHQAVAEKASIIPIAFVGYSVFATRGLLSDMEVGRDCVLFYDRDWTMDDAMLPVIYDDEE